MPQIGDSHVWKVLHFQSKSGGQQVLNVYHYHYPDLPLVPGAQSIAEAFNDDIVPLVAACQSDTVLHERVAVEQLGSLTDYYELATTVTTGDLTGESLPVFNALRLDYVRASKETRSGSKRIAGLIETWVSGDFLTATGATERAALASALGDMLTVGIFTVEPVILGIRYVPDTDPKIPLPVSEWVYNPISGVVVNSEITTQNSRKRGRGA